MVKITFTQQAKSELREIKEYIALHSPLQAERVVNNIIAEIQKIPLHPTTGRPVIITATNTIRQILVYKYRIFYREHKGQIQVLSIFHSSRLLDNNPGLQQFFEE